MRRPVVLSPRRDAIDYRSIEILSQSCITVVGFNGNPSRHRRLRKFGLDSTAWQRGPGDPPIGGGLGMPRRPRSASRISHFELPFSMVQAAWSQNCCDSKRNACPASSNTGKPSCP
jgi:hypothetical protein